MINDYTEKVIQDFLAHYNSKGSQNNYDSAVRTLFRIINKDVRKLTYEDYIDTTGETSQDSYRTSFFKYIYAYNILENPSGLDILGNKDKLKKHFLRQKESINKEKETPEYKPTLTFQQIEQLETLMDMDHSGNLEMQLWTFCWYMLFHTDCEVNELRINTDSNEYRNGKIVSTLGNEYDIPLKFEPMLNYFKSRPSHTGFGSLKDYIEMLGNLLNIEGLTPMMIKKARSEHMLSCGECGKQYLNVTGNWVSVNNRIVCTCCGERLKKNFSYELKPINDEQIETVNIKENPEISSIVYTFDKLQEKLIKEKDYLEIHKFLIQIGKAGEAFVYDLEREKLKDTDYFNIIDNTKAKDARNGYDILSYTKKGQKLYIEVKTSVEPDADFYITKTELDTYKQFRLEGKKYIIYRVTNILAKDKKDIQWEVIEDILENPAYKLEEWQWKVKNTRL